MTNPSVLQIFTEDRLYQSLFHECTNIFHQYVSSILKIIRNHKESRIVICFLKSYKNYSRKVKSKDGRCLYERPQPWIITANLYQLNLLETKPRTDTYWVSCFSVSTKWEKKSQFIQSEDLFYCGICMFCF